jgi:hypothetical protein
MPPNGVRVETCRARFNTDKRRQCREDAKVLQVRAFVRAGTQWRRDVLLWVATNSDAAGDQGGSGCVAPNRRT